MKTLNIGFRPQGLFLLVLKRFRLILFLRLIILRSRRTIKTNLIEKKEFQDFSYFTNSLIFIVLNTILTFFNLVAHFKSHKRVVKEWFAKNGMIKTTKRRLILGSTSVKLVQKSEKSLPTTFLEKDTQIFNFFFFFF